MELQVVKILQDMPKGLTFGPFAYKTIITGQTLPMPKENALQLIADGLAEEIIPRPDLFADEV